MSLYVLGNIKFAPLAKTFLFDLAGVLINWETMGLYESIFGGDRQAVSRFFDTVLTQDHLSEISKGRPTREVLDALKVTHPDYATPLDAWIDGWDDMVTGPIGGTVDITRELRRRGCYTYILGNWSREEFDRAWARFDFLDEFHGVVISGDHGVMKPSAEIFEIATQTFNLTPADTIFVDDTQGNVNAAKTLGFDAIHFTGPESLRAVLSERGCLADV